MHFPDNLKYTKDHEWIRTEGSSAIIGITDFAQRELGDIVYIEVETIGQKLAQGEIFGTVEAVKTVSDLFMPVSGEIHQLNEKLQSSPESVNKNPYEDGWIIKINLSNLKELDVLMSAEEYKKSIGQ